MVPIAGLGKAFIEVHADTRPFAREIIPEIEAILAAAEKALGPTSKKLGEAIGEKVADGVRTKGEGVSKRLKDALTKDKPKVDVDVDVDRSGFSRFLANARTGLLNLGTGIKDSFGKVFGGLRTFVANIFNIPEASPVSSVLTVLAIAVIPALIGGVISLAAAIADLLGFVALVPAAFGAILALIPPLIIGFKGIGNAVELAFEKDPEKFREGLKQLSPSVQGLAKLLREFVPVLERIGKKIETAFIDPIVKVLRPALKNLLPVLEFGFENVAGALGRFIASLVKFLGSPRVNNFLGELFPTLARIIDRVGPAVIRILDSLVKAAEAALPFLERVADSFGDFLENFAELIDRAIADGRFNDFLEDAFRSFRDIKELLGAVLGLLRTMFAETDDKGRNLIDIFTDLFRQFDNFFSSPKGKALLRDLADLAILFADNLKLIIPILAALLLPFIAISKIINQAIAGVRVLIELIRKALGLSSGLTGTGGAIGSAAGRAISGVAGFGAAPGFAEGGITRGPSIAGEKGPELILPLTKPNRAAALLAQAGLTGATNVYVFLGTDQITDILDVRVERAMDDQARALANGPRDL